MCCDACIYIFYCYRSNDDERNVTPAHLQLLLFFLNKIRDQNCNYSGNAMTSLKVVNKPKFEAERMHVDFDMCCVYTLKTVEQLWYRQYICTFGVENIGQWHCLLVDTIPNIEQNYRSAGRLAGLSAVAARNKNGKTILGGQWKILQDNKTIMDFLEGRYHNCQVWEVLSPSGCRPRVIILLRPDNCDVSLIKSP